MENLKKCNKCNQPMKVMNTLEGRNFCSECRDKYCFKGFTGEWYIAGWDEKINNYMPSASMVNKCSMNCKHKPEDLVRGKTFTLNCAECDKEIKLGATVILLTDYWDEKQLKQVEDKNKKICVSCWLAGKETKWANYCWIMQFDNIHEDSRNCSNRKVLRNISEPKQAKEREREREYFRSNVMLAVVKRPEIMPRIWI